jgi:phage terminase large subunit-like protein
VSQRQALVYAAMAVEEARKRRSSDPLAQFVPFSAAGGGQTGFLDCAADEAWYSGANRIGKSDCLAVWTAAFARFGNPNPRASYCGDGIVIYDRAVNIWVVSPTFGSSRDIMQPKIFDNGYVPPGAHRPFVPDYEVVGWHAGNNILRLKNGSIVGFKTCDQGQAAFYGVGKDAVVFDEPPDESVYNECVIRLEAGRKLWIRGGCTLLPDEGRSIDGVSWLFPKKIQPWIEGKNRDRVAIFTASLYDNPYLGRDEITRLESLWPEGSIERRIRVNGELIQVAGGVRAYPPFNRLIHVNPALNRRQHLDWRLPLLWCLDFNVEPMGSTVWQLQNERGVPMYRGFAEITIETDAGPLQMAEEFRRIFPAHGAEVWIYGDATGKNRGQTGRSNYTLLFDGLRGSPFATRMFVPEANPNIQDRINAVNVLLRDQGGRNRVEVCSGMLETIADFEQVVRSKDGKIKKTTNKKDPYFRRTSWTDGFGYMAAYREPATRGSASRRPVRMKQPNYAFGGR